VTVFDVVDVWIRGLPWWWRLVLAFGALGFAGLLTQAAIGLGLLSSRRRERRAERWTRTLRGDE
jgi:hypothetical protein